MITHEIMVEAEPPIVQQNRSTNRMWPWSPQAPKEMSKLEYAHYIEDVKKTYKVGDILVGNYDVATRDTKQLKLFRFFMVMDIQEIHSAVRYVGGRPECLYIRNLNIPYGGSGYWTSIASYDVIPYDDLPDEVKKIVDARNNSQSTPSH